MEVYVSGVLNLQPAALNAARRVPLPVIRENPSAFDFLVDPQVIYEFLRTEDPSLPVLPSPFSAKDLVALKERLSKNEFAALLIASPPSVLEQLWVKRPAVFGKRRSVSFAPVIVSLLQDLSSFMHCYKICRRLCIATRLVVVYALLQDLSSFMHCYKTCRRLCIATRSVVVYALLQDLSSFMHCIEFCHRLCTLLHPGLLIDNGMAVSPGGLTWMHPGLLIDNGMAVSPGGLTWMI